MKRNIMLDGIKLLFAVIIAFHHYGIDRLLSSEIVVISFFIISGYFLLESFDSNKYNDAWEYTKQRIKKIYPLYIVAFLFRYVIAYGYSASAMITNSLSYLPEIFLVQNIGVYDGAINSPLWFFVTMLVASHILFGLLSFNRNLTVNVISPILALTSFTYMANIFNSHIVDEFGVIYGIIYVPLFRAFGAISAGIAANAIIKDGKEIFDKRNLAISNCVGFFFFIVFLYKGMRLTALVPFIIVFMWVLSDKCIINILINKACRSISVLNQRLLSLDKISLSIFFFHGATVRGGGRFKRSMESNGIQKREYYYSFF